MIKKIAPFNTAILLFCGWIAYPEVFLTANESVLARPSKNDLEHHVEVVVAELAEGDIEQLPIGVQVVHDRLGFPDLNNVNVIQLIHCSI